MSGHSKWSTIKRQKGATDAKRGAVFTKLGNAIAIATREGRGVDQAIEKARAANMGKELIQRSIDRGLGRGGEGAVLESALYEGFGPGGVAVMVEAITDNKTRTGSQLRSLFEKHGGTLGGPGAVSYLFTRVGEIELEKSEGIFEKAVEAGAQDVEETENSFLVYTKPESLHKVGEMLGKTGSLSFRPNKETMATVSDPEKLHNFLAALEELDDVQEVYVNVI